MGSVERWEELYNQYKSQAMKSRFDELEEIQKTDKLTAKELDEYSKIKRVMANLDKVDNLRPYIADLHVEFKGFGIELNDIESEIKRRSKNFYTPIKEVDSQMANLDFECDSIIFETEKLEKKLRENNSQIRGLESKEEIQKLEEENESIKANLSDLNIKLDKNKKAFRDAIEKKTRLEDALEADRNSGSTELQKLSDEELNAKKEEVKEKKLETSKLISKANIVATSLMNGFDRESIKVKLDEHKYKAKTKSQKIERKERKEKPSPRIYNQDNIENLIRENWKRFQESEETSLIEVNEFEKAFPRLAKIFPRLKQNALGRALVKVKSKFSRKNKQEENPEVDEKQEEDKKGDKNKEFRDKYDQREELKTNQFMLDVAEYGVEEAQKRQARSEEHRREERREKINKKREEYEGRESSEKESSTKEDSDQER